MSARDGGPAFPQSDGTGNLEDWKHGMTMRQFYKAAAMKGLLACPSEKGDYDKIVRRAAEFADTALREDAAHEQERSDS